MQSRKLDKNDYQALAEFRYRIRAFLSFSEQSAHAIGLEPQQHQLLLIVKGFGHDGQLTIGELAKRLKVRHHSAGELVNRAEASGLVERARAEDDRRHVYVRLTEQGEKVLRELSIHHLEELRSNGPALVRSLTKLFQVRRENESQDLEQR
jgi:DNA-binding MarR family transcriptional regulator